MAGRPAKVTSVNSSKMSKEEREERAKIEDKIKGNTTYIKPLSHLNDEQKKIFENIKNLLKKSNILGQIDTYILSNCSIAIYRIIQIEEMVNTDPHLLYDDKLMNTKKKYTDEFFRCCNELCLSPQSRAKIASAATIVSKETQDPLLAVLGMK